MTLAASPAVVPTRSVSRVMGSVLLALAPTLLYSIWIEGPPFAIRLVLMTALAIAIESMLLRLRGQPVARHAMDLSAPVTALLLAFVLPASLPWWMACLGIVAAIGLGKQAFGGLGDNPFNPAMLGYALLLVAFPAGFESAFTPEEPLTRAALLAAGGAYLLTSRSIGWQAPLGFVVAAGSTFMAWLAIGGSESAVAHPSLPQLLFAAIFIVTDPVTGCLSGRGRALFGIGAGALLVLLGGQNHVSDSLPFAVLLMNCAAPWIDGKTRPLPANPGLTQ